MKFGIVRSGAIGVGSLPGVAEDIAAWASHDVGKTVDKEPGSFGKGNILGVICAQTANNACIGGALIPVLALGIGGSAPATMLLGALNLHGIRPDPMLPIEFPQLIPQMASTLVLASLVMLVLGIALTKVSMQILRVPVEVLMPFVAFISVLGAYALGLNLFNVYVMLAIGLLAYFMQENGYPVAPAVIGLILGNMADTGLRRALPGSEGSLEPFFTRPVALVLIGLIAVTFVLRSAVVKTLRARVQRLWRHCLIPRPDR